MLDRRTWRGYRKTRTDEPTIQRTRFGDADAGERCVLIPNGYLMLPRFFRSKPAIHAALEIHRKLHNHESTHAKKRRRNC